MTNDRNEAKPRRPQLRTYTKLWKSIWLVTAIVVTMALACQEQEPAGDLAYDHKLTCNGLFRSSLMIQQDNYTAELGNRIVEFYHEQTHPDCDPDTWNPKISSNPQTCQHAEWEDGRPVPESLAQAAENDSDGFTVDKAANALIEFSQPPTGRLYSARCWIYHGADNAWDRSVD